MKISWIDILLILFGLFIAYQLLLKIFGGSWQTESLIIGLLIFNLRLTWKLGERIFKLDSKFDSHIEWHKAKDKD